MGDTAIFYCQGEKVTWQHQKGPLPRNTETWYDSKISNHVLKIINVQLHDGGDYQCFGETSDCYVYEDKGVLSVICEHLLVYVSYIVHDSYIPIYDIKTFFVAVYYISYLVLFGIEFFPLEQVLQEG